MAEKKKLFVLCGGPSYYQIPIFRLLGDEFDVRVFFYSSRATNIGIQEFGKAEGIIEDVGVDIYSGYKYRYLKNWSPSFFKKLFKQINFDIIGEIIKEKPDFFWINGWNYFTSWLIIFVCFFTNTKLLMRSESPLNQELNKTTIKSRLKRSALRIFFKFFSGFMYIGQENKKFYKYLGVPNTKLFFTPYAVDNNRFIKQSLEIKSKRSEYRRGLNIADDDVVVLFVGKLVDKKRPMDLLSAYEMIESQNKSLIFVGDGDLKSVLEKYIYDKKIAGVHFVGFKDQIEIGKYYSMSDIFVLPSGSGETWGLVVNEAMCFGLPVVVSDVVGCGPDLVKDGENGYIYPCGDKDALLRRLEELARDKELRGKFGARSQAIIRNYSYEKDISGFLSLIGPKTKI